MADPVQSVLTLAVEAEEATRELPMPVIAYLLITFGLFVLALGVTWTFRNTAYKVQPPHPQHSSTPGTALKPDGPQH